MGDYKNDYKISILLYKLLEKYNYLIFVKLLMILIISIKIIKNNLNKKNIKVCLCSPGKTENKYIREFVRHYKKYNIDKIFIYDNNDINGEKFEDVINDYIKSNYVKIIDFRGKKRAILEMMNNCYQKNYNYYDWIIFFEIDEFIYLKNYKNIKNFLAQSKFNNCQRIQLNWLFHTDNNQLYYDNRPLKKRFPDTEVSRKLTNIGKLKQIKSILRGHIPNITINSIHTLVHSNNIKSCDGFGRIKKINGIWTDKPDYKYYYIDHYFSKSTEEFINKINKGDVKFGKDNILGRIGIYFRYNEITKEKLDLIENGTGLSLSAFRNKLNNK